MIKISFRHMIVAIPVVIFLASCVWSWSSPTYDGTLLGDEPSLRGLVRVLQLGIGIIAGITALFIGILTSGLKLWDKNPTLTIGRKKTNLTKARTVERKG